MKDFSVFLFSPKAVFCNNLNSREKAKNFSSLKVLVSCGICKMATDENIDGSGLNLDQLKQIYVRDGTNTSIKYYLFIWIKMVYCAAIGCNSLSGRDKQYASDCTQTSISMVDKDTQTDWEKDVPLTTINLPDVNLERTHESILDISDVRSGECDTTWNANNSDDSSDKESFEDVSDNEAINFVYNGECKFIVYE
ncbi:hypothetical protein ACF0H5_004989 [Mactra antiquata]